MPLPVDPLRNLSDNIIGLPDTCEVVRQVQVDDGRGSWTWEPEVVGTEDCRLTPLNASETASNAQYVQQATAKVTMRHTAIVDAEDRIRITSRPDDAGNPEVWEVTGVPPKSESMRTSTKAFVRRDS